MTYNYDLKGDTENYSVMVDTNQKHGYFEHHTAGDAQGGELTFAILHVLVNGHFEHALELTDYDGVAELPYEVTNWLRGQGLIVDSLYEPSYF